MQQNCFLDWQWMLSLDSGQGYTYNESSRAPPEALMIIDVSQQLKETTGSIRHYRFSETGDSPSEADSPIRGELSLLRTDRGIFVNGILDTTAKAVCSRCLGTFDQTLSLRIEEEFLLKGEGGAFTINENQEIDLSEAVRQYALLALPMKPLCREDCQGLCPSCGHNLNLGPCGCLRAIDPRLAGLTKLISDEERTG